MPSRLKFLFALCLVALLLYISSGVREGRPTLFIGVPSLPLGVLAQTGAVSRSRREPVGIGSRAYGG